MDATRGVGDVVTAFVAELTGRPLAELPDPSAAGGAGPVAGVPGLRAGGDRRAGAATRGIDLNALVGREFTIGPVRALGQRRCEPCVHLQRLTRPGVVAGLVHRGGLRADVLSDGEIRVGDAIAAAGQSL
ncbi:MAG TPA: MOSC domain-containing protein [Thermomicrobiaceae bacterium]|nr:MOSC domain-containing protein [Thermomicrobiaceae bacterium]